MVCCTIVCVSPCMYEIIREPLLLVRFTGNSRLWSRMYILPPAMLKNTGTFFSSAKSLA